MLIFKILLFCELNISDIRYKVYMAVKSHIVFFWGMTLYDISEEHKCQLSFYLADKGSMFFNSGSHLSQYIVL